jgi:hypothetical protein
MFSTLPDILQRCVSQFLGWLNTSRSDDDRSETQDDFTASIARNRAMLDARNGEGLK